jgi:hypothetical protein
MWEIPIRRCLVPLNTFFVEIREELIHAGYLLLVPFLADVQVLFSGLLEQVLE